MQVSGQVSRQAAEGQTGRERDKRQTGNERLLTTAYTEFMSVKPRSQRHTPIGISFDRLIVQPDPHRENCIFHKNLKF
jgi:hypothetical protein